MNSRLGSILGMYGMAAAMAENMMQIPSQKKSKVRLENISGKLPDAPLPKGCERYYFIDGFETIASSQKAADKKHDKFLKQKNDKAI